MQVQKLADLAGAVKLLKAVGILLDSRNYHDLPSNFTLSGLKAPVDLYTDEYVYLCIKYRYIYQDISGLECRTSTLKIHTICT